MKHWAEHWILYPYRNFVRWLDRKLQMWLDAEERIENGIERKLKGKK